MMVIDPYVAITAHFSTMSSMGTSVAWCTNISNVLAFGDFAQELKIVLERYSQAKKNSRF
jgi:hypothetical protein